MKQQLGLIMLALIICLPLLAISGDNAKLIKQTVTQIPHSTAPISGQPTKSLDSKLDQIVRDIEEMKKTEFLKNLAILATPIVSLILGIWSIRYVRQTLKMNEKQAAETRNQNAKLTITTLQQKTDDEVGKAIRQKLDEFYGPLIHLLGVSKRLYGTFAARRTEEEKKVYASKQGRFSTLVALIKGKKFTGIDDVLLNQILEVGKKSEEIISSKLGLVEDQSLRELLWRVGAHYRLIDLAMHGKLNGATTEFDEYTFPAEIDDRLAAKEKQLQEQLVSLQKVPELI